MGLVTRGFRNHALNYQRVDAFVNAASNVTAVANFHDNARRDGMHL